MVRMIWKLIGAALVLYGLFGVAVAMQMDTTVSSPTWTDGYRTDEYIYNTGLIQRQTMDMALACLAVVAGVLVLGFASQPGKMEWRCTGAGRETGRESTMIVVAYSATAATKIANRHGLLVAEVELLRC